MMGSARSAVRAVSIGALAAGALLGALRAQQPAGQHLPQPDAAVGAAGSLGAVAAGRYVRFAALIPAACGLAYATAKC